MPERPISACQDDNLHPFCGLGENIEHQVETAVDRVTEHALTGSSVRLTATACEPVTAGGWIDSVEEREAGVASVSAPVVDRAGRVIAAVSISGPVERLTRSPGERFGADVVAAGRAIGGCTEPTCRECDR